MHGDKDQGDRQAAIVSFKLGEKDVLVATGAYRCTALLGDMLMQVQTRTVGSHACSGMV